MKTNYHTHHYRCLHAKGDVIDYVEEAVKHGYDILGMSCHVPYENFPELAHRMRYDEIDVYLKDIEEAQEKYPEMKILKAFECEYFVQLHDYYVALSKRTDYLILAQHEAYVNGKLAGAFGYNMPIQLKCYAEALDEAMATQLFSLLAHPDVFMTSYPKWDKACIETTHEIAKSALKHKVVLELNANGFRRGRKKYKDMVRYPYPVEAFWKIIATEYPEIKIIINSDCHNPKLLNDEFIEKAERFAKKLKLNIITELPLK